MIYSFSGHVRFSEIDENGKLTPYGLINYLQDCATFHGEAAGCGFQKNRENHRAWVIASLQLKVKRYPVFNEKITVSTWVTMIRGMIATRQFSVENEEGELLAAASSDWVFMDMQEMRPARVPQEQTDAYGVYPDRTLHEDLGKRKIRFPDGGCLQRPITVQEYHLDINGHVNNGQYVRMALKLVPSDWEIRRLRVEYRKQSMLGDVLIPIVHIADSHCFVRMDSPEGEEVFLSDFSRES